MSGITGDIKKLFNFKYKTRNDSITDQYNRVYMMKALLVAAFLTGMKWYEDDVNCVIPEIFVGKTLEKYGPRSCWINGFYVYKELRHKPNFIGYYGLPSNAGHNGTNIYNGKTCFATPGRTTCAPMTKMFYLQYQWFPFYLAALALFYYIPYIFFRYVNNDLITLKKCIKLQNPDLDGIVNAYFSDTLNSPIQQNVKVLSNVLIKIGYLLVNVLSFVFTDSLLNGDFRGYGNEWLNWSKTSNSMAHNYVGKRFSIKPGERLLPTFGFCAIQERGKDAIHTLANELTSVCEISQHVLYHYVLIALWFLFIIGMIFSIIGIVVLLAEYAIRAALFASSETVAKSIFSSLTVRQRDYLDFIRKKNIQVYGELIRKLYNNRISDNPSNSE